MSFLTYFSLSEAFATFDAKTYRRYVKAGQALASKIDGQLGKRSGEPISDDVKQAIMLAQLIAAIEDPVTVLQHLARYLAMNGDFWAAGKLQATYRAERQRKNRQQKDRRKGARSVNTKRKSDKRIWVEAATRAGRRIRATQVGARFSDSELARRIVKSREFGLLKARRPSWRTVRTELSALKLSRAARRRKRVARS